MLRKALSLSIAGLFMPPAFLPANPEAAEADLKPPAAVSSANGPADPRTACSENSDCFHTGCSSQFCASQGIITPCEYRCEYGCYAQASCKCFGGRCGFRMDQRLVRCVLECGSQPDPFSPLPASASRPPAALRWRKAPDGRTVAEMRLGSGKTIPVERLPDGSVFVEKRHVMALCSAPSRELGPE